MIYIMSLSIRTPHTHMYAQLVCCACQHFAKPLDWRCGSCGGPLEFLTLPVFDEAAICQDRWTVWRYEAMLPSYCGVSLGEGCTPLVSIDHTDGTFLAKLEYLAPTASYKDRGTVLLVNHLVKHGVRAVVEDSSGNAGASLAAYAAAAGIRAQVFVPAHASSHKKQQIQRLNADLVEVVGPRSNTALACLRAAEQLVYASHAWSPLFIAGQMTCAWELWEQLGRRAPAAIVCPVGQGNLLLGLVRGFQVLLNAKLIDALPRFYAVQAESCAPIVRAWETGVETPGVVEEQPTIAEGIRTANPVRGRDILRALRESSGGALHVDDAAILRAQARLAEHGLFVEPTSAVPLAALQAVRTIVGSGGDIVVPLTGSGLKMDG